MTNSNFKAFTFLVSILAMSSVLLVTPGTQASDRQSERAKKVMLDRLYQRGNDKYFKGGSNVEKKDSLEIFSRRAFRKPNPKDDFVVRPEKRMATEYLASKVEVVLSNGSKKLMPVELAMLEYAGQAAESLTEAEKMHSIASSEKSPNKAVESLIAKGEIALGKFSELREKMVERLSGAFESRVLDFNRLYFDVNTNNPYHPKQTQEVNLTTVLDGYRWIFGRQEPVKDVGARIYDMYTRLDVDSGFNYNGENPLLAHDTDKGAVSVRAALKDYFDLVKKVEAEGVRGSVQECTDVTKWTAALRSSTTSSEERERIKKDVTSRLSLKKALYAVSPENRKAGGAVLILGAAGAFLSGNAAAGEAEPAETDVKITEHFDRRWARPVPTSR